MRRKPVPANAIPANAGRLDGSKLAASQMLVSRRRAFQAAMPLKQCEGSARQADAMFAWRRRAVQLGLHEKHSGVACPSAQSACTGNNLWEEKHPDVADSRCALAQPHSQQDRTFRSTSSFTRLTAAEALDQLRSQAFDQEVLPSASTMAEIPNRNGYRLRPVFKTKPQKKVPETDAILANIQHKDQPFEGGAVVRLSMDCKATVNIGEYSRSGTPRSDNQAVDHDMGCREKYTPFGIVNEDGEELHLTFGSSAKTSDFIVDALHSWWERLSSEKRGRVSLLQIKTDDGPESDGRRTQFPKCMVQFADHIGLSIYGQSGG